MIVKVSGAVAAVKCLELENVKVVFGYPGAAICPFYDALSKTGIRHVLTRHEQGAAHAASGYARATGKTGVCIATSGPGATNLITGIATAYMDSIPLVAITGQVSTELIGKDVFQEADITGAVAPFCKHGYLVKDAKLIPKIFKEAFYIASTGRPGPVLIDLPVDVQYQTIDFIYPDITEIKGYKPTYKCHPLQIKKAAELVLSSKQPVIVAGGGVISADASEELAAFAAKCQIPVATTLMGIGSVSSENPLNLGMIGSHGAYGANFAVNNADLIIILGARVGDRAMGSAHILQNKAAVIHIDIDPAEIGKNISATVPIVGNAKSAISDLTKILPELNHGVWIEQIKENTRKNAERNCHLDLNDSDFVDPKFLIAALSELLNEDDIIATEVGQNQIWSASSYKVKKARTFITSGGMGTMGYGLPAAIGAKIGKPSKKVVVISGDGSFQMSMNELGTIKQEGIGVKIILFNNRRLGMVRELQKNKYQCNYYAVFLDSNPDFTLIARAYGFRTRKINKNSQVFDALKDMLSDEECFILECEVDPEYPTL